MEVDVKCFLQPNRKIKTPRSVQIGGIRIGESPLYTILQRTVLGNKTLGGSVEVKRLPILRMQSEVK